MSKVYLVLGSNIGNRRFFIQKAIEKIKIISEGKIKISSLYQTAPWGVSKQMVYFNIGLEIQYPQKPFQLINKLKKIERQLGRKEKGKNLPRTIDIDIILWDKIIINSKSLQLPHPRMHDRNFVLIPIKELNPMAIHPIFKKNVSDLQKKCTDSLEVKKI